MVTQYEHMSVSAVMFIGIVFTTTQALKISARQLTLNVHAYNTQTGELKLVILC